MTDPQEGTLDWFLNQVVKNGLNTMIQSQLHYLSFAVMGSVIELLGAVYDFENFHQNGVSQKRFNQALQNIPSLTRYAPYTGKQVPHDLWTNMRCGMAHVGKPGPGVVFTQRNDAACGNSHLRTAVFNGKTRLILVCEDLYDDIIEAIEYVCTQDANLKTRLNQSFMDPNLQPDLAFLSTTTPHASG